MGEGKIKVTDKRMFTPEGELREEFRHLEKGGSGQTAGGSVAEPGPSGQGTVDRTDSDLAADRGPHERIRGATEPEASGRVEVPGGRAEARAAPGFLELLNMLAQPALIYLGDARPPDGRSLEDLELARLHIDVLDVLREKTVGNLSPEESSTLEDLIYQLRLRYVEKQG